MKPPSGNGRLLWHALGAKTVELINENVHVEVRARRRRDAGHGRAGVGGNSEERRARQESEGNRDQTNRPPAQASGNPKFTALGERLEKVKERHEQGFLTSLEFLKEMLELAKEVVEAEKEADPWKSATAPRKP